MSDTSTGAVFRPREALGLRLPDRLPCVHCTTQLILFICWDRDLEQLCCIRCANALHRLDETRFVAVTVETRGRVPGMEYLSAAEAIAVLMRCGASSLGQH